MERILFSALGDTDPIRGFYDGACLHIARHYRPALIVLVYTKEMGDKEHRDHRYTRALRRLWPDTPIEEIFSEVANPQHFDAFNEIMPQAVNGLLERFPQAEILLNLSSGTPQMKTVMSILAVDFPRCLGVQVDSPERGSNRGSHATQDDEDIDALLENNLDDEEGAPNRCTEPPLRVFRYYAEKNRILSLVDAHEYAAALRLAKSCPELPGAALALLQHAAARSELLPDQAREALRTYQGKSLFPLAGKAESLVEYFLLMQLDAASGRFSNMLVRVIPFLYDFLLEYEQKNVAKPLRRWCQKRKGAYFLERASIKANEPGFLVFLDQSFPRGYDDSNLSFLLLYRHGQYLEQAGGAQDAQLHQAMLAELGKIERAREIRNLTAHEMVNVTGQAIEAHMGMSASEMLNVFWRMLLLLQGKEIQPLRGIYGQLGQWIHEAMR